MKQLKMIRYSQSVVERPLPEGYSFAFFKNSQADVDAWCEICRRAEMVTSIDNNEVFDRVMRSVEEIELEEGLFFVLSPTGERVATSALIGRKSDNSGYLHMVAAIPEERGRGIGGAMLSFAMMLAEERGFDFCRLTTDDFRLAAIKSYFSAGFKPVLYGGEEEAMSVRWGYIYRELGLALDYGEFIVR